MLNMRAHQQFTRARTQAHSSLHQLSGSSDATGGGSRGRCSSRPTDYLFRPLGRGSDQHVVPTTYLPLITETTHSQLVLRKKRPRARSSPSVAFPATRSVHHSASGMKLTSWSEVWNQSTTPDASTATARCAAAWGGSNRLGQWLRAICSCDTAAFLHELCVDPATAAPRG
jgi:hypothetical protein